MYAVSLGYVSAQRPVIKIVASVPVDSKMSIIFLSYKLFIFLLKSFFCMYGVMSASNVRAIFFFARLPWSIISGAVFVVAMGDVERVFIVEAVCGFAVVLPVVQLKMSNDGVIKVAITSAFLFRKIFVGIICEYFDNHHGDRHCENIS